MASLIFAVYPEIGVVFFKYEFKKLGIWNKFSNDILSVENNFVLVSIFKLL